MKNWTSHVKGNNNDMLSISQPQVIQDIYRQYLEIGGSNIIGTNTFSSTTIAMADYDMQPYAYEMNYVSARLAREVCDEVTARDPTRPRFVAGAFVRTYQSYSVDSSIGGRWILPQGMCDVRCETYLEQVVWMDRWWCGYILMVETIFDTLNCESGPVCDDW
jgi:5-methyltetrahydrofolate--homocysteine methyltransferase